MLPKDNSPEMRLGTGICSINGKKKGWKALKDSTIPQMVMEQDMHIVRTTMTTQPDLSPHHHDNFRNVRGFQACRTKAHCGIPSTTRHNFVLSQRRMPWSFLSSIFLTVKQTRLSVKKFGQIRFINRK